MTTGTTNNETEIWKWIPDYEWFYLVSNFGNVKSNNNKGRVKSICINKNHAGYRKVRLWKRNKVKVFFVHRLVAAAFLDKPPEECTEINHKDNNRENNRVENLEWVTRKQNMELRWKNELPTDDVNVVEENSFRIIATCRSINEASKFSGVAHATIKKIIDTEKSIHGYRFERGF
jgi:hypothetical protein